ncbi:MAG: hypothetical protein WAV47_03015 [Blastocatellia bacterium]
MASETSSSQSDEIQKLIIEAARTQLAAISAATRFWAGWAQSADKYTQAISDELAKISEGTTDSKDIVGRMADLTREYLRNLADLPNAALQQFSGEVEKLAKPQAKRTRSAKAKE